MKKTILNLQFVVLAWLATSICTPSLQAQSTSFWDFNYTGSIVQWTVPTTGIYDITAYGAQGGSWSTVSGGLGAEIGGSFLLSAGEIFNILAGGAGANANNPYCSGGGGGGGGRQRGAKAQEVA